LKKYVLIVVAVGLFTQPLKAESPQARSDRWGRFGVGSWASYRTVAAGKNVAGLTTFKLLSLTDNEVTVEITMNTGAEVSKKRITFPFARENKPDHIDKETVAINGRKLKCRVLTYQKQGVKVWQCDDVPGFLVKDQGPKTVTTLVDFRAFPH
jgi:hypothetical protein